MTTPHPQADLLRAIADGKQMQEERIDVAGTPLKWVNCSSARALYLISCEESNLVRIKPDTVTINGIECPAPMVDAPEKRTICWAPTIDRMEQAGWTWHGTVDETLWLESGLCFVTKADAEAVAEAMLAPLRGYMERAKGEKK